MANKLARRELLRGRLTPSPDPIRPPGALLERDFLTTCVPCPDCIRSCPQDIIVADKSGRPRLDFSKNACTFCRDCERACTTGALDHKASRPWNIIAKIAPTCLSLNAIICRSCAEHCEEQAIRFKLMLGGRSEPQIDNDRCTGCGACLKICPNKSIAMLGPNEQIKEMNT